MTNPANIDSPPGCFGDLETVFPKGTDGLRHSPETCLACRHKTECLKKAMESPAGLQHRETLVDRAARSGIMGFFERWNRKKTLDRRRKQSETGADRPSTDTQKETIQ